MMQTVTTQPDRLRNPLVIVQVILIGLLGVSLTLGALFERDDRAEPTVVATSTATEARSDRDGNVNRHGERRRAHA